MQQFCILLLVALCPHSLASVSTRCFTFKSVIWLLSTIRYEHGIMFFPVARVSAYLLFEPWRTKNWLQQVCNRKGNSVGYSIRKLLQSSLTQNISTCKRCYSILCAIYTEVFFPTQQKLLTRNNTAEFFFCQQNILRFQSVCEDEPI